MKIIDKILHPLEFKILQKTVLSSDFPWYFSNTAHSEDTNYSWSHLALPDNKVFPFYQTIEPIFLRMLQNANESITKLFRIRLGLHTVTEKNLIDAPHVDFNFEHKVGLFYLTSTDGTTKLYNESFDYKSGLNPVNYFKTILNENVTIMNECMPVENRLLLFNGSHYHSSTSPTVGTRRVTINFNYI